MKCTTLCYIEQEGKWLMLYRNKKENDENEGKWIGIGGKLEAGESPDDCLVREVKEETGLTLTGYTFKGVITFINEIWGDELMFLYTGDKFEGELVADCPEGRLEWVKKEDVLGLNLWPGDILFLKELIAGSDKINMKLVYRNDELKEVVRYDGTCRA